MNVDTTPASLTIVVVFYKNADYLRRAVESVLAQPRSKWALVIVDNSVDDAEHRAAEALVASFPQNSLRYIRHETHLSLSERFNRCLELAETDLVALVHGDDEVLPRYAQEFLALAARHPEAAVLFTGARIIDRDSHPCFSFVDWFKKFLMPRGSGDFVLSGEPALRSLLRGNWIYGGAVCYRKSLLGDLSYDRNYLMTIDLERWCRVILSGRTIAGTRRPPAYLYRRHSEQITAQLTTSLDRFREESRTLGIIADRAAARGWTSAAAVGRARATVQLHLLFLAVRDITRGSIRRACEKLRLFQEIRSTARLSRKMRVSG